MNDESPLPVPVGSALSARAVPLAAVILFSLLVLPGIRWGLPSELRNTLTFGPDRSNWCAPDVPPEEADEPWRYYPNSLEGGPARTGVAPRSAYNPIRSHHPDEYVFFKSLSGMRPSQLKLSPGFFGWPALQIYVVGAALKAAAFLGAVELVPEADFYFRDPDAMARLYVVGRLVTWAFGVGCIILIWLAARNLFGEAGGAAAAMLTAVTPLLAVNSRYLTADVPMLFWICATLLASTYILQGGGLRAYLAAGVCLGLAAGTRYQGGASAFVILAAHLSREPTPAASEKEPAEGGAFGNIARRLAARNLWLAAGISVLIFLATNPYILLEWSRFRLEFLGELRGSRNPASLAALTVLFVESGWGILYSVAAAGAVLLAFARSDRRARFVLLAFGLPTVVLWLGKPAMVRYLFPLAPLPPLICAWAFAEVHRRGVELGRCGSRLAAPLLLCAVLAYTLFQSVGQTALYFRPESDTRTRAGVWIAGHVPAGSSVGVLSEPWQFELPALDKQRYRVMIVSPSLQVLAESAPEYVVASDLQFPPVAVRGPLNAEEAAFRDEVMHGGESYSVAARFESWPPGRKALLRRGPHDMRYANPVIVVVKRK